MKTRSHSNIKLWLAAVFFCTQVTAQNFVLKPDWVFDGEKLHENLDVWVKGDKIEAVGKNLSGDTNTQIIECANCTLLPGLIEGHSHLFLHPYNETSWNDQVLKESRAERTARAVVHAQKTLEAGFTTVRDLGTEGADYDDVGLKTAIDKGIIVGPRMLVAGRALVATGSYGPKTFNVAVPQGAEEADGHDDLIKAVRRQIGQGIDLIKIYADYRWGLNNTAMPTFSIEEIETIVKTAAAAGRPVVAHASTVEGMRRAVLGGVKTIEHGDGGTTEIFKLMRQHQVALCPTLAAGDAVAQYLGWKKAQDPEPERIVEKRKSFKAAVDAGVTILMGGDVGVFAHGDNVREMEMMEEYGMETIDVLRAATATNAEAFGLQNLGHIKKDFLADLLLVEGNPAANLSNLRKIKAVWKGGVKVK